MDEICKNLPVYVICQGPWYENHLVNKDYLSPFLSQKGKKKKKRKKKSLIFAAESWLQCSVQHVDKLVDLVP